MSSSFAQLEGEKYLSIETYRRTGAPVRTPVWFVESGGVVYIRTSEDTGKYKRIKNNPVVKIAPCDMRGNVKGEWVEAEASLASSSEAAEAHRLIKAKYGAIEAMTRFFLRRRKYTVIKIRAKDSG